ncbi:uncharacterized protein [Nicotiana tomentosiformis]|uniref:uncharacterized protein n=1 Tax=Nicotiana tomentosiformis TaxID=4098 RepID=UPI00388C4D4B
MRFHEFAHHANWLVPSNRERIRRFIDGLTYQLRLFMTRETVSGATFDEVVDIARQIEMVRSQERGERQAKKPRGSGGFSGVPSGAQSSFHVPSIQGSSTPGSSSGYSGAGSSLQSPPPFIRRGCFECRDIGHIKRYCPRLTGGPAQQRIQSTTSAPVTSPLSQLARGEAQSARGRPRGEGRSGGSQARFYTILARPDVVASDTVITGIVSVFHREASVLFDHGSTYSYALVSSVHVSTSVGDTINVEESGY